MLVCKTNLKAWQHPSMCELVCLRGHELQWEMWLFVHGQQPLHGHASMWAPPACDMFPQLRCYKSISSLILKPAAHFCFYLGVAVVTACKIPVIKHECFMTGNHIGINKKITPQILYWAEFKPNWSSISRRQLFVWFQTAFLSPDRMQRPGPLPLWHKLIHILSDNAVKAT